MVAALSPADINYDETLSTLRCAWPGGPAVPMLGGVGLHAGGLLGLCGAGGDCSEVPAFMALSCSHYPSWCPLGLQPGRALVAAGWKGCAGSWWLPASKGRVASCGHWASGAR